MTAFRVLSLLAIFGFAAGCATTSNDPFEFRDQVYCDKKSEHPTLKYDDCMKQRKDERAHMDKAAKPAR